MLLYLASGIYGEGGSPTPTPTPTPTPSTLLETFRVRYPAFAAVADASVSLWLDEGAVEVAAWPDAQQARAAMLYAAHNLASQGLGTGAIPGGVTSFKSGTFSASVSDSAARRTGFSSTVYGREYLALMRRYFGGPRLAWTPPEYV